MKKASRAHSHKRMIMEFEARNTAPGTGAHHAGKKKHVVTTLSDFEKFLMNKVYYNECIIKAFMKKALSPPQTNGKIFFPPTPRMDNEINNSL